MLDPLFMLRQALLDLARAIVGAIRALVALLASPSTH
jgi:hypothetical protein